MVHTLIQYEDDEILVCNKPAGVPTQTKQVGAKDLVSMMKNHVKGGYLALINRLDQPVEGIVLFAKTQSTADFLSKQMQQHNMQKEYMALVTGTPKESEDLEDFLVKDGKTNQSKVVSEKTPMAKKARLHYDLIKQGLSENGQEKISQLAITLYTGRHHQIRVQCAHAGIPLLGDGKYGGMGSELAEQFIKPRTIALCAVRLTITHPKTKKEMVFEVMPSWQLL